MALMIEQMRIIHCRQILCQQLMTQFCRVTKFGRLVQQVEMLMQQFHSAFFHGVGGVTFRGLPKLVIDTSDVVYHCGGAFHKWQRKENGNSGKYAAAKSRIRDLDIEVSGMDSLETMSNPRLFQRLYETHVKLIWSTKLMSFPWTVLSLVLETLLLLHLAELSEKPTTMLLEEDSRIPLLSSTTTETAPQEREAADVLVDLTCLTMKTTKVCLI